MNILKLVGFLLLSSFNLFAGGGFLWFNRISHATHLPIHTITFIFVSILFVLIGIVYRIQVKKSPIIPSPNIDLRNIVEYFGGFILSMAEGIMGKADARRYFTFLFLTFTFIFINNLMGVIPGFVPATDNLNTTLGMSTFVFLYYNFHGVRVQGFIGHLKHFMGPILFLAPLMFIIELISHMVRPLSLGLRLKGNLEGDHIVLGIFSDLVPYIVPVPFYALGIFVSFIQAFVFTLLTMIYIASSVEVHDHENH